LNAAQGGYGRSVACSDGDVQVTDRSQATCVAGVPTIASRCATLTVGDVEGCASDIGTNLCAIDSATACATLRPCL
jgi:hypothetical protein